MIVHQKDQENRNSLLSMSTDRICCYRRLVKNMLRELKKKYGNNKLIITAEGEITHSVREAKGMLESTTLEKEGPARHRLVSCPREAGCTWL